MVLDYKGTRFSFNNIKKARRQKRFKLIILGLVVIFLYFLVKSFLDARAVSQVQDLLLQGKQREASERFQEIESSMFHGKSKTELKALLLLFAHRYSEAEKLLATLDGNPSNVNYKKFLAYFADHAEYQNLGIYCQYFLGNPPTRSISDQEISEEILYYLSLYQTATFNYSAAEHTLKQLSPQYKKEHADTLSLIEQFNQQTRSGKINYIFDTNDRPLASYDIKNKKTLSLTPGFSFDDFNPVFQANTHFYALTLDLEIQQKIHLLFRDYYGSFILLNLSDCSITAAYSKPFNPQQTPTNPVFSQTYEPGSIIKLITLLTYWRSGKDNLFPFQCQGVDTIDNTLFYDWIKHGEVVTADHALAVSCNIAFAKMSIIVGFKPLEEMLKRFFFNSPPFSDSPITFKTGSFKTNINTPLRLAHLAVGLSDISITTFHASLLSAIIAQNGSIYLPHLIKNKKNLMKLGFYHHTTQLLNIINDNTHLAKLKTAMVFVVESADGTGKRARLEEMKMAIKTGTSGDKDSGLDAIITGFFPADKPQYAFAFRLEHAGKAEVNGALLLKKFLSDLFIEKKQ